MPPERMEEMLKIELGQGMRISKWWGPSNQVHSVTLTHQRGEGELELSESSPWQSGRSPTYYLQRARRDLDRLWPRSQKAGERHLIRLCASQYITV